MEECDESVFDKGETINTKGIIVNPLPIKKNENTQNGYFCHKCSSLIQILSINKKNNNIEFECTNKNNPHRESINIEKYLSIRNRNVNIINENGDICDEHKEKFTSFCFECKKQLCIKCQKNGIHISHKKVNLIEIEPTQEELTIFKKIIDYYNSYINNLKKRNYNNDFLRFSKDLEELEKNKNVELKELKNKKINEIDKQKNSELEKIKKEYLANLGLMKEKYKKEMLKIKNEYIMNNNRIINEHKLKKDKIELIYLIKNSKLNQMIYFKKKEFHLKFQKKNDELPEKINNAKNLNDLS